MIPSRIGSEGGVGPTAKDSIIAQPLRFLGYGVYTIPEAARLTRISRNRIRRYLRGYSYKTLGAVHEMPALWQAEIPMVEGRIALSFKDLIELRFVNVFREHGVSWKVIRLAIHQARELLDTDHPFSTKKFKTDGRTIFAEIARTSKEKVLLDLTKNQFAFRRVIKPSLYTGLEFSKHDEPILWRPIKGLRVILDPERCFGQPIVSKEGVPTSVLAKAFQVERSMEAVAKWYELERRSVKDAIEFEKKLAA